MRKISNNGDFSGTLTLFRNDLVKIGEENDSTTLKQTESEILSLEFVNGTPTAPPAELLLDNGDYFWVWTRAENTGSAYDITLEFSGEVFSMEPKDREIISVGDDPDDMYLVEGVYTEILEGEVGFCNKDAVYEYMTDDGGELAITIKSGTVFESDVKLNIYVQNSADGEYDCIKTLTVTSGKYTAVTVLFEQLSI